MKIYTTSTIENNSNYVYVDFVSARTVRALSIVRDIFTTIRDFFGGRSKSYQKTIDEMEYEVKQELLEKAEALGANAIIGFSLDFDNIGSKNRSLLMATAKGTAVKIL